jgi:hypothetical protein
MVGMEVKQGVDGGGLRYDDGKQRFDLIPVQLLEQLAAVYTYGASKYADWNWARGMKWSRIVGSMFRHFVKFMQGERLDKESGLPHLAHMFWNAGTLLFYSEMPGYEQYDDRHKGGTDGISKA